MLNSRSKATKFGKSLKDRITATQGGVWGPTGWISQESAESGCTTDLLSQNPQLNRILGRFICVHMILGTDRPGNQVN